MWVQVRLAVEQDQKAGRPMLVLRWKGLMKDEQFVTSNLVRTLAQWD
jgi:hypothetical protein